MLDFKDMKKAKRGRKHYVVKQPILTMVSPVAQHVEAAKALLTKKKKAEKKKSFLQIRNIDDDNAEAAEMARLEAQSDKVQQIPNHPYPYRHGLFEFFV